MSSHSALTRRQPPSTRADFDIARAVAERDRLLRRLKVITSRRCGRQNMDHDDAAHRDRQAERIRQDIESLDTRIRTMTLARIACSRPSMRAPS